MSLLNEHLFAQRLSSRLERFKRKSATLYNFKCCLCGDSKTNKTKTRAYLYEKAGKLSFHCHNCNQSMSFGNFLKQVDAGMYREFMFAELSEKSKPAEPEIVVPKITKTDRPINLPTIESLSSKHLARSYVEERLIPNEYYSQLYYAKNFGEFIDELNPGHDRKYGDEPRLVIPFRNEKGVLVGVSGRDLLGQAKSKYMTVKLGEDDIKYFTKKPLNHNKKIYVMEGPIDSYFIDNSIATMDSNLLSVLRSLNNTSLNYTFVFDNEPRNPAIISGMEKVIKYGYDIFIRPPYVEEKDINDMVKAGYVNIQKLIDDHTYNGLAATIKMTEWRKK